MVENITERKQAEEQIAYLAYHDKLTDLANRPRFQEVLEASLARAHRRDLAVGVIFLDLDNFKLVNDSLGHEAGDELLVELAERLSALTRETDLVARPGGDEFLLLLADLASGSGDVAGHRCRAARDRGGRRAASTSSSAIPSPSRARSST